MRKLLKILCHTFILTLFLPAGVLEAQNNQFGVSDSTYTYYRKCLSMQKDSVVLRMSDTLFHMAKKEKDVRMQIVSEATKMDYFYYNRVLDSLIVHVDKVKVMAKKENMLRYYYFSWSRIITFYINERYYDTALGEIALMQDDAIENNYSYAVSQSCQMMGRVYHGMGMYDEAALYFEKAAEIINGMEKNDPDRKGLSYLYCITATEYLMGGRLDEAKNILEFARLNIANEFDLYDVYLNYARYGYYIKDTRFMKVYLDSLDMFSNVSEKFQKEYKDVERKYYILTKEYEKVIEICDDLINSYGNYSGADNSPYLGKANALRNLGRYKEASALYSKHISDQNSLRKSNFAREVADKAIQYKIKDLEAENQKHEIRLRNTWLVVTSVTLFFLVTVLVIVLIQFGKIKKLNDDLKRSEQIKSAFLQNLSHEIRTPLNSIVGFSQILNDSPDADHEELKEYTQIVLKNSKELLILFTQAHEAWNVQSSDSLEE